MLTGRTFRCDARFATSFLFLFSFYVLRLALPAGAGVTEFFTIDASNFDGAKAILYRDFDTLDPFLVPFCKPRREKKEEKEEPHSLLTCHP